VASGWWLAADGWWLVAGGWWLVASGWWLVGGGLPTSGRHTGCVCAGGDFIEQVDKTHPFHILQQKVKQVLTRTQSTRLVDKRRRLALRHASADLGSGG
jgi:hypothetical protein